MTPEEKLKKLVGTNGGMRVPEGYFPDVMQRISASLPQHPLQNEKPVQHSWWVKARPIVYMAAMFAGIWLMMQVVTSVQTGSEVNMDNPPALLASALEDKENMHQVMATSALDEQEVFEEIVDDYDGDFKRFAEEFNKSN